jgi:hypothetical protein
MIKRRPANTRGYLNPGWIETYRTFSNNSYLDPRYMNFSVLEVINDDRVQPGNMVPIHEHKDMEILGYVVEGPCFHNDNFRNLVKVPSGAVQRMSSGTGIWHTEGNLSDHPIHYLQIWMRPNKKGFKARYDVWEFSREEKLNNFCPIASQNGPIEIQSDAIVHAGIFTENHVENIDTNRKYYLYIISGSATINGVVSDTGDGYSFEEESVLEITDATESEMLLFNLP